MKPWHVALGAVAAWVYFLRVSRSPRVYDVGFWVRDNVPPAAAEWLLLGWHPGEESAPTPAEGGNE